MENTDLVKQETGNYQGLTHPKLLNVVAGKLTRLGQIIETGLPDDMQQVTLTSGRPFCNQIQQKVTSICLIFPDPLALAGDALSLPYEHLDLYALPPVTLLGKVVSKLKDYPCRRIILIVLEWPNALVLRSGGSVRTDPLEHTKPTQSTHSALQSDST